jgi:hypothetical protein
VGVFGCIHTHFFIWDEVVLLKFDKIVIMKKKAQRKKFHPHLFLMALVLVIGAILFGGIFFLTHNLGSNIFSTAANNFIGRFSSKAVLYIASVTDNGKSVVLKTYPGSYTSQQLFEVEGSIEFLVASPDKKYLVFNKWEQHKKSYGVTQALYLVDVSNNDTVSTLYSFDALEKSVIDIEWSSDSKYLAMHTTLVEGEEKENVVFEIPSGEVVYKNAHPFTNNAGPNETNTGSDLSAISWNPNNLTFAYILDGNIVVADLKEKNILNNIEAKAIVSSLHHKGGYWNRKPLWISKTHIIFESMLYFGLNGVADITTNTYFSLADLDPTTLEISQPFNLGNRALVPTPQGARFLELESDLFYDDKKSFIEVDYMPQGSDYHVVLTFHHTLSQDSKKTVCFIEDESVLMRSYNELLNSYQRSFPTLEFQGYKWVVVSKNYEQLVLINTDNCQEFPLSSTGKEKYINDIVVLE